MEIERKFLISALPEHLSDYPCHKIEQAYLCTDPVIRIRRQDNSYILTYKSEGMLSHEECNLPLTADAYEHLKPKADGILISKRRYCIPFGKHTIELDIFEGETAPLILAEVEFPTVEEAEAFLPPEWFAEDVTYCQQYHNSYISRHGYHEPFV